MKNSDAADSVPPEKKMEFSETEGETEFISILGANEKSELPHRVSSRSLPDKLPVLGLSDIVIFPGALTPTQLRIGPIAINGVSGVLVFEPQ